jgi:hypothetical protein
MNLIILKSIAFLFGLYILYFIQVGIPYQDQIFLFEHMWSNDAEYTYSKKDSQHPIYTTYYSVNHLKFAPTHYKSKPKQEKLIVFVVIGNHGSYI